MAAALAHGNIAAWYPGDHTAHEVQHPPALYIYLDMTTAHAAIVTIEKGREG